MGRNANGERNETEEEEPGSGKVAKVAFGRGAGSGGGSGAPSGSGRGRPPAPKRPGYPGPGYPGPGAPSSQHRSSTWGHAPGAEGTGGSYFVPGPGPGDYYDPVEYDYFSAPPTELMRSEHQHQRLASVLSMDELDAAAAGAVMKASEDVCGSYQVRRCRLALL